MDFHQKPGPIILLVEKSRNLQSLNLRKHGKTVSAILVLRSDWKAAKVYVNLYNPYIDEEQSLDTWIGTSKGIFSYISSVSLTSFKICRILAQWSTTERNSITSSHKLDGLHSEHCQANRNIQTFLLL